MDSFHHFLMVYLLVSLTTLEGIHTLPEYKVINPYEKTKVGHRFESEITKTYVEEQMASASRLIWETFEQDYPKDTKDVKEITLYIGHIYLDFLQSGNEINVDLTYIQTYKGDDLKKDFTRRLYHAMTNIWQWAAAEDSSASHLRESIADFVVLKAGYATKDWVRGQGNRWDQNSIVTALFLDYCNTLRKDVIAKLNNKLRSGFKKDYFRELFGMSVDELWAEYKLEHINGM